MEEPVPPTEPDSTAPPALSDEDATAWLNAWATAESMGRRGMVDLQGPAYFRAIELAQDSEWWDAVYHLIGRTIHRTSGVEQQLAPLLTYLLNADRQTEMIVAVSKLSSSSRLDMLSGLLDPDWEDGATLVGHLRKMLEERNKLAHGTFMPMKFEEDGSLTEGMFHTRFVNRRGQYVEEEIEYTKETFASLANRLSVLQIALTDLLRHLVALNVKGEQFDPQMRLLPLSWGVMKARLDNDEHAVASFDADAWAEYGVMFPNGFAPSVPAEPETHTT